MIVSSFAFAGAYNFRYDKANRLISAISTSGPNFSESLSYDANGNILSLTRSTNPAINYTYDTNIPNRLNSVSNGLSAGYTYDANKPNRLNSVSGGLSAAYQYDGNGNMTSDNTRGNFTYDYRNLPIAMALTNSGVTVNIQNQTLSGTYSNSSGDSVHIKDVTINAGSNVTIESKNAMRIEAGFSSNGATVSLKPGVSTAGSGGASYTGTIYQMYDGNANRVKYLKGSVSSPQDGSRIYVRGTNGNILAEYTRSGSNWNLDHYNLYGNGHIGKLNAANQRFYNMTDHLGSTRVVLDEAGNVSSWYDYYSFGAISRSSESANSPKEKFTGYPLDDESGFYYGGARYYNAGIARFISVDPLARKFPMWTPYQYAFNNPLKFIDATGMAPGDPDDEKNKGSIVTDVWNAIGTFFTGGMAENEEGTSVKMASPQGELQETVNETMVATAEAGAEIKNAVTNIDQAVQSSGDAALVVGTIGLVAAPFTYGASLELTAYAGAYSLAADATSAVIKQTDAVILGGSQSEANKQWAKTGISAGAAVGFGLGAESLIKSTGFALGPQFRSASSGRFVSNSVGVGVLTGKEAGGVAVDWGWKLVTK